MRIFGALLVLLFGAGGALAAELNCQQIRLITPYPPGGAADVASRVDEEAPARGRRLAVDHAARDRDGSPRGAATHVADVGEDAVPRGPRRHA